MYTYPSVNCTLLPYYIVHSYYAKMYTYAKQAQRVKKHINNINKPVICQTNLPYSLPAQK